MSVHSIKVPMTATREGVIPVISFNRMYFGDYPYKSNKQAAFSFHLRGLMPLCCFKRKNTVKVGIATAVAVLLLPQHGSRNVLTLPIGADKPVWDCPFSSPCLGYPQILGEGKTGNKYSSCSPTLKITEAVLLQHEATQALSKAWNIYSLGKESQNSWVLPVSFYHHPNRSGDCGRKVYFSEDRHEPVASYVIKL